MTKKVIMIMEVIMIVCVYAAIGLMAASAFVDYEFPFVIVAGGMAVAIVFVTKVMVEFHNAFWG